MVVGLRGGAVRHAGARTPETGAVAVEFVLVLPVLAMLLIGTVTTGVSYSRALGVTNAVREGARFGATANASTGDWAGDVIARVRATQFDDSTSSPATAICVQLVKGSASVRSSCNQGNGSVQPALGMPPLTAYPSVPAGLPATVCVVRVVAARNYTINAVFARWDRTMMRGSVARYERDTC